MNLSLEQEIKGHQGEENNQLGRARQVAEQLSL